MEKKTQINYFVIVVFWILIPVKGYSQEKADDLFRFYGGIQASRMDIDSLDTDYAILPGLSLFTVKPINKKLKYMMGGGYAIKGANNLTPYYKFRLHYVTAQVSGIYRLMPNIEVEAGLQGGYLMSAKLISSADNSAKPRLPNYKTEMNITAGAGFQIQENLFLNANYYVPLKMNLFHQFSFSLNYYFIPENLGKKNKDAKKQAYLQIAEMKNSFLLVRLASADKKVEALQKQGYDSLAGLAGENQNMTNLEIIHAFQKYFDFCPVYFFYNSQTSDLLKGSNVLFLNDELKEDTVARMSEKNYFIGELGNLNPVFSENSEAPDYVVLSDATKYGFIIYDRNLHLLSPPFPYFVKGGDLLTDRNTEQLIWLMNKELHSFYNQAIQVE